MKIILINLLILINIWSTFSQKNRIYIIYDSNSNVNIVDFKNDTLTIENYSFNLNKDFTKIKFNIDKNKNLIKILNFSNKKSKHIKFTYENCNDNNIPILCKKSKIKNYIKFKEMLDSENFKNLIMILSEFEEIYIINEELIVNEYYIVKKVKLI